MRTLALLAALLLLALQTQAKPLQETAEQVFTQDLPEAEDQDQYQPGDKAQDTANSLAGADRLARDASGLQRVTICHCRRSLFCRGNEQPMGTCKLYGIRYRRCCQ